MNSGQTLLKCSIVYSPKAGVDIIEQFFLLNQRCTCGERYIVVTSLSSADFFLGEQGRNCNEAEPKDQFCNHGDCYGNECD